MSLKILDAVSCGDRISTWIRCVSADRSLFGEISRKTFDDCFSSNFRSDLERSEFVNLNLIELAPAIFRSFQRGYFFAWKANTFFKIAEADIKQALRKKTRFH